MSDRSWKALERRVARQCGGRRIPVTGIDRHGADVLTPLFAVQVKLRRSLPRWLFAWLDGIRATAGDRTGILILKKPHMLDRDALVVLTLADWIALHGEPKA